MPPPVRRWSEATRPNLVSPSAWWSGVIVSVRPARDVVITLGQAARARGRESVFKDGCTKYIRTKERKRDWVVAGARRTVWRKSEAVQCFGGAKLARRLWIQYAYPYPPRYPQSVNTQAVPVNRKRGAGFATPAPQLRLPYGSWTVTRPREYRGRGTRLAPPWCATPA